MGNKNNIHNLLGKLQAENDIDMLESSFYNTRDYLTIIESDEPPSIVVGRRGTGKSALCHMLKKKFISSRESRVVSLFAEETEVIGILGKLSVFGDRYEHLRAGCRIVWEYAILMELALEFVADYKIKSTSLVIDLNTFIANWVKVGSITKKIRLYLNQILKKTGSSSEIIASLADDLKLTELRSTVSECLSVIGKRYYIIIDKLDEGYSPNVCGIGFVGGAMQACVSLNSLISSLSIIVFVRDNITRSVIKHDPDYSRNLEGEMLRLHWEANDLFNLICNRLRNIFGISAEKNRIVWNECVHSKLRNNKGFQHCLKLTLYRPRDLIALLNGAFYIASKQDSVKISIQDINVTAKDISTLRLNDLEKEYREVVPALSDFIGWFREVKARLTIQEWNTIVDQAMEDADGIARREVAVLETPLEILQTMYGVGFVGLLDKQTGSFVFCHDGKNESIDISDIDELLIHPCYWLALGLKEDHLDRDGIEEIHDEYEIKVTSETPENRKKKIGQHIAELNNIPQGHEGASHWENWCLKSLRMVFADKLDDFESKPNKNSIERRDIVAANTGKDGVWKAIFHQYGVKQVVFECKNYTGLGPDEFKQLGSYLTEPYGRLGFFVTRDEKWELQKGPELSWVKHMWDKERKVTVKLTAGLELVSKLKVF